MRESSVLMPAIFIGSLIAGAIQVALPRDVLVSLDSNPLWSILAMLLLAFMRTTFTARVLVQLSLVVALMSAFIGLVINFVA